MESITINYCAALGLVEAGVLPKPDTQQDKKGKIVCNGAPKPTVSENQKNGGNGHPEVARRVAAQTSTPKNRMQQRGGNGQPQRSASAINIEDDVGKLTRTSEFIQLTEKVAYIDLTGADY